jgi:hypothetical protein
VPRWAAAMAGAGAEVGGGDGRSWRCRGRRRRLPEWEVLGYGAVLAGMHVSGWGLPRSELHEDGQQRLHGRSFMYDSFC